MHIDIPDGCASLVAAALYQNLCFIETNSLWLRASEAIERNRQQQELRAAGASPLYAAVQAPTVQIKQLGPEQIKLVAEIEAALTELKARGVIFSWEQSNV